jgi:nucleoside 2-deoxyribosyltransferase
LAAPLFSEAELFYNTEVARNLRVYFDVYLPQEDGGLMFKMIEDGVKPESAALAVFKLDIIALEKCDLMLIVLDGRSVDEGAAFECGFAFALKKPCYGIQTDARRLLPTGNNPMLSSAIRDVFSNTDELLEWARLYPQGISNDSCHLVR